MEKNETNTNQSVPEVEHSMKMPSRRAIGVLVAAVVIIAVLVVISKMNKSTTPSVALVPSEGPTETICYYGSRTTASGFNDTYALKLTINGMKAEGQLLTAPAEKDMMKGTLSGVVIPSFNERIFDGTYENTGEGMKNVDERVIKLSSAAALVGYGDVEKNEDGSYSYTDKNALNYSLRIPAVNCAVYDEVMQTPA